MTTEIHNELDFSNWLSQNIHIVNEHTAWDILPGSIIRERGAWNGARRVDLFCKATRPGCDEPFNVIIENQLWTTDDDHFARIMAYIAAFDAKGAVWIARGHTRIHKRVVRWINDNTNIDAYILKLDLSDSPSLTPIVYPGMPEDEDENPISRDAPLTPGWQAMARNWFERVLPKVAERCKRFGAWQTQTRGDLKQPIPGLMWCVQPVMHHDSRVSEYISWYIELHPDFVRIGLYIPNAPRDKSHHYFNALTERKAEMEEAFGAPLEDTVYRGGPKHIIWEPHEGVGYESTDQAALEREAEDVANSMENLIAATKDIIANLTPYEASASGQ